MYFTPEVIKPKTVKEKGEHELTTLRSMRRKLHRIFLINVHTLLDRIALPYK
ncbi:hypothetical protein HanPSC8_Chr08g0337121 [Helianthus annuus]|nr:hypothetical protein HanPSC8_Chr08g0337121 [Helianthus annuus]